jgi:hypothetical protein
VTTDNSEIGRLCERYLRPPGGNVGRLVPELLRALSAVGAIHATVVENPKGILFQTETGGEHVYQCADVRGVLRAICASVRSWAVENGMNGDEIDLYGAEFVMQTGEASRVRVRYDNELGRPIQLWLEKLDVSGKT